MSQNKSHPPFFPWKQFSVGGLGESKGEGGVHHLWYRPFAETLFTMKSQVALGTGLVSVDWTITNIFWFNYLTLVNLIRRMLKEVRESHDTGCRSVLTYKPKSLQVTSNIKLLVHGINSMHDFQSRRWNWRIIFKTNYEWTLFHFSNWYS